MSIPDWYRYHRAAYEMRQAGATYKTIGEKFSVTPRRARTVIKWYERQFIKKWTTTPPREPSHVHIWHEHWVQVEQVSVLSHYRCECGAQLTQDSVLDILNGKATIEQVAILPFGENHK